MLFDSIEFAIFLPIVFILYWLLKDYPVKLQNAFLIAASYLFYGWWDWRFLILIFSSSAIDYLVGLELGKTDRPQKRKRLLMISILINIGMLSIFKYFDFFANSFASAFTLFGSSFTPLLLNVILPVGISFYTLQTLSYSIDVYKKKLEPTTDALSFFAFVSFFPQLVAGPIERAANLLPQFFQKRIFDYHKAADGMRQILWGLFKKIVVADNCARLADPIFENPSNLNGGTLIIGAILFTFQIYGDFSGYSDIAIGTARIFGFDLKSNFRFPYFSRNIVEFWQRWHISLSTWFRDYLYIPLGGNRFGLGKKILNTFIVFAVSGLWHGAKWNFVIWGLLHAFYTLPYLLIKRSGKKSGVVAEGRLLPSLKELLQMGVTLGFFTFSLIFFRAENIPKAFTYLHRIFSDIGSGPVWRGEKSTLLMVAFFTGFMLIIEWLAREKKHGFEELTRYAKWVRWSVYVAMAIIMIIFKGDRQEFIYFQF